MIDHANASTIFHHDPHITVCPADRETDRDGQTPLHYLCLLQWFVRIRRYGHVLFHRITISHIPLHYNWQSNEVKKSTYLEVAPIQMQLEIPRNCDRQLPKHTLCLDATPHQKILHWSQNNIKHLR